MRDVTVWKLTKANISNDFSTVTHLQWQYRPTSGQLSSPIYQSNAKTQRHTADSKWGLMWHIKGSGKTQLWGIIRTLDGLTHRMVDSPHNHAEQRVACAEELHFLGNEVLFLGLRFARNRCSDAGRRSHFKANWLVIAVCVIILKECLPLEVGTAATSSRLSITNTIHLASLQIKVPQFFSSSDVPHSLPDAMALTRQELMWENKIC